MISPRRWVAASLTTLLLSAIVFAAISIRRPTGASLASPVPRQVMPGPHLGEPPSREQDEPRFVGVVLADEAVDVTARIVAHVEQIRVRTGDGVQAGAVLAVLDSPSITHADLAMAEAELRSGQAEARKLSIELAQARERLERTTMLNKRQLVSAEQFGEVRYVEELTSARLASVEELLAQKRAQVEQRASLLSNLEVRAPFGGVIAIRYVDRGWSVGPGIPIVRLVRTAPLKLRFAVPTSCSKLVHIGLPVSATIEGVDVTLAGVITIVAPEVDSASQMLVVEAILQTPEKDEDSIPLVRLAGRVARVTPGTRLSDPAQRAAHTR